MVSDEEKKAIENLKTEYEKLIKEGNILFPLYKSDAKRLINLIEKQSKEIEELKDESKEYQIGFAQGCYEKDLDWKDKIKAKIEELDYNDIGNFERRCKQEVLQSLLEKE